jgi:hypothetical protein
MDEDPIIKDRLNLTGQQPTPSSRTSSASRSMINARGLRATSKELGIGEKKQGPRMTE